MNDDKPMYHVVVFGSSEDEEEAKTKTFPGEVHGFVYKRDLNKWLNEEGVNVHKNGFLAGQCMMQLPDGRAMMVFSPCRTKILKRVVSVRA